MAERGKRRISPKEVLILENSSFQDSLKRFGFKDVQLTPGQALAIIVKAEKRLGRVFTKEEWSSNQVVPQLIESDFTAPYEVIFL